MRTPTAVIAIALLVPASHTPAAFALSEKPWVPEIDPQRLHAHIAMLPEQRSVRGDDAHRAGLAKTEAMLIEHLAERGFEPQTQEVIWTHWQRDSGEPSVTTQNIWIDLPGSERPGEVFIVGAHFDCVPNSPGADDNGSGVAAVLELAEALRERPRQRTVRLMLFTAEEYGLTGARRYAHQFIHETDDRAIGMISLDMIGYFTDEPDSQQWPIPSFPGVELPTVGNFITLVASGEEKPFSTIVADTMSRAVPELPVFNSDFLPMWLPDMRRSDHAAFLEWGIPAMHLTDTSNFRYVHYHKPTDTLDRLDMDRLAQVTAATASVIDHLANAELAWEPQPPRPQLRGQEQDQKDNAADAPVEVGR